MMQLRFVRQCIYSLLILILFAVCCDVKMNEFNHLSFTGKCNNCLIKRAKLMLFFTNSVVLFSNNYCHLVDH